jgi:hypothetical protein
MSPRGRQTVADGSKLEDPLPKGIFKKRLSGSAKPVAKPVEKKITEGVTAKSKVTSKTRRKTTK